MSTIAVFGVLGGGAYAAAQIGADDIKRNAVRSKHVKKRQVGRNHLKARAVSAAKLATGAVKEPKIATGAVTEAKLADGAVTGAKVNESTLETVPNADRLDGVDAAELLRGRGGIRAVRGTDAPDSVESAPFPLTGAGNLTLDCRNPASAGSVFKFHEHERVDGRRLDRQSAGRLHPRQPDLLQPGGERGQRDHLDFGPRGALGQGTSQVHHRRRQPGALVEARIVFLSGECSFNVIATEMAT